MNTDRFKPFPTYDQFHPRVPVWCVTPTQPGCIHRFFDTSPISPSGRFLAVFQLPCEDRLPEPGEPGRVAVVDLETGDFRPLAETRGWEPQLGANLNWGGSDHELFFNDVDLKTWKPFAWKFDPLRMIRERWDGSVYHASADGRYLISANMTTMRVTQPGYGVAVPDSAVRRNIGPAEDDGFYLTETRSGKCRLLISIADALRRADPPVHLDDPERMELYGFHSKFNPQGDLLMLSLRWFPVREPRPFNMFRIEHAAVRYAWIVTDLEVRAVHCAIGPEQWEKGGHHATWFPDGRRISMNLNIDRDGLRFVQVNADGSDLRKILPRVLGSGHPTVAPDGRHILTDSYLSEPFAYAGTVPLRWIDLTDGTEREIVRISVAQPVSDSVMRVDPHPAWDRTGRFVTFNGTVRGSRHVFVADLGSLLSE